LVNGIALVDVGTDEYTCDRLALHGLESAPRSL